MTDDYNNTKYYLQKRGTMCGIMDCDECPLSEINNGKLMSCNLYEQKYPEEAIAKVKEWHEKKEKKFTYKVDFLSKFPNAKTFDGYPLAAACFIYPKIRCKDCPSSPRNCKKCWDIEMED